MAEYYCPKLYSYLEQNQAIRVKISDWQELSGNFNGPARWIRALTYVIIFFMTRSLAPRQIIQPWCTLSFIASLLAVSHWISRGRFGGTM